MKLSRPVSWFLLAFGVWSWIIWVTFVRNLVKDGSGLAFDDGEPTAYFWVHLLLAVVSVFVAPLVQRAMGTVPAILLTLALFGLDLAVMAVYADHAPAVITGIVLSGALIGNNNTLITEAVMGVAPVERPVASAAYSFVRFCGGAIGPYVALKLFGAPPDVHVHAPFWFGAAMVAVGFVILACGARLLTRTLQRHHETSLEAAEAVLVGDLD